jgi:hypothetical protein
MLDAGCWMLDLLTHPSVDSTRTGLRVKHFFDRSEEGFGT